MQEKKQYTITRYKDGTETSVEDEVVTEYCLQVIVNGKQFPTLLCTPKNLPALVTGFLFTEGILNSIEAIDQCTVNESAGTVEVTLTNRDTYTFVDEHPLHEEVDYDRIIEQFKVFNVASKLFQATGGVHSCALCDEAHIVYLEEDIGRHNALDKVIGLALIQGIELHDKMLFTSGRISSEIIGKLARSGIPVIVSRSAPTDMAIEIARKRGIRLIGFARGRRLNIYS